MYSAIVYEETYYKHTTYFMKMAASGKVWFHEDIFESPKGRWKYIEFMESEDAVLYKLTIGS